MNECRCAIYARYSTDKQSPLSIQDQIRKCTEHAAGQGWQVLPEHVYSDGAMSGSSSEDRPGLCALVEAISMIGRPFDVLLVDDTSRLSRHQATAMQLFERVNFAGVRVVAVAQGIDSSSEQADVLMAVHGLIDHQYVKELAAKTRRGLEGKFLRGLHAGGRCFGYRTEPVSGGVRLEVDAAEAATVKRIFEMSASGYSLKAIAKALNAERLPAPRPRRGRLRATWCPSAIREMLRRELYLGRSIWNRARFIRKPGSHKRIRRERPQSEWRITERPELRIITDELWQAVQGRLVWANETYGRRGRGRELIGRGVHHLLTGFIKCGECGHNLTIVSGCRTGGHPTYGCPQNSERGACSNDLREREDWLEERLFSDLQSMVLTPEAIDYAMEEFGVQLKAQFTGLSSRLGADKERKAALQLELERLWSLAARGVTFDSLQEQIGRRERELREITDRLLSASPGSVEAQLDEIRAFVERGLTDIRALLHRDIPTARAELAKHVKEIRMVPSGTGAQRFYVAEGEWNLLAGYRAVFLKDSRPGTTEIDGCGGLLCSNS